MLLSLLIGSVAGVLILHGFAPVESAAALWHLFASLLQEAWILKTLAFAVLVGSIMTLLSASGGVAGFVHYVRERRALVRSQRSALLLTYGIGVLIFIESSITSMIAGTVGRPLTDAYGVSRAKLAYVCDATSAPVCSLIVFNGWGALLLGLIAVQTESGLIEGNSVTWLLEALPYNFYALAALGVAFLTVWYGIDIGPMRRAAVVREPEEAVADGNAGFMLWPIGLLLALVFAVLWLTGGGNLLEGSGSTALFYATTLTVLFCIVYYRLVGGMPVGEGVRHAYRGAKSMAGIAAILLFAFAISEVTKELETGLYIASFSKNSIAPQWIGGIVFLLAAVMAFATGTSWGTFSIMIPIAVPLAVGLDADVALCIGAVISGGVFGDHCSPISDTTIISSMAARCDHIEHVKTQLPYALISGGIALACFWLAGWLTGSA